MRSPELVDRSLSIIAKILGDEVAQCSYSKQDSAKLRRINFGNEVRVSFVVFDPVGAGFG